MRKHSTSKYYAEYLASPLWASIRKRVLKRDGGRCRSCGARATQVHHACYDDLTMRGGADENLYSLCRPCHEAVTFDVLGQKRPMLQVTEITRGLDSGNQVERRINAARTAKGGWTRAKLAAWGIEWPPKKGWKKRLIAAGAHVPHRGKKGRKHRKPKAQKIRAMRDIRALSQAYAEGRMK